MSGLQRKTELRNKKPMQRGEPPKRTNSLSPGPSPKGRKQTKKKRETVDNRESRDKVVSEGFCRACGVPDGALIDGEQVWLEAAHVIPKALSDEHLEGPRGGKIRHVPRDAVIPLCAPDRCHAAQHASRLDLLPVLTRKEEVFAVRCVGLGEAYRRVTGGRLD